ncbi:hypothetical protein SASPL_113119 [Salvia splendens]|uniref:VQ domain-containing protein n=1 Tax=Salvia splendens TaxID=180675 RepID=A0A8X8Y1C7_SALSN|nr:hypothetical protein SASPL_113119 [Salvia splendens]
MSDAAASRSLRGARPSPLSISKQSHNITKQKTALPPPPAVAKSHRSHPPPPPVIIYAVSPKKINVEPGEFKAVVQRLTGLNPSSPGPALIDAPPQPDFEENGGGGEFPAEFSGGGAEMPQNLLWNGTDFDNLHGNRNVNNFDDEFGFFFF